ncbi:MAG: hypothetical protein JO030_06995, partial [Candidatus Eremiobacteraeota bacterium]|nr:hypothetical protein [Candidatus Eremiobacteraeota bacterium]
MANSRRLFVRARTIVTCDTHAAQNGITFDELRRADGAAIVVEDGHIAQIVPNAQHNSAQADEVMDLPDCVIFPGFVDAHAHPLYAGNREPDFAARNRGEKALQGMLYTVEQTRQALLEPRRFYETTIRPRLQTMLAHGTTTLECKTGYALHKPGEAELLDLIAAHKNDLDVPRLVPTFLG